MRLGKYRHFKGTIYEVIGVARHSETMNELVIYRAVGNSSDCAYWVRPKDMFLGTVTVDGVEMLRFTPIED
ncbi:DUF1653 domain-containing protein [Candidatus Falkowbacteria bacterium]|nr:DUF1653 domain-containing protein [Candidatus Falkowbacteria bacterium]